MQKPADNTYDINEYAKNRWSPRAFSTRPVEEEKLLSLLEAARWSPSAMNLQPWSFIVGTSSDPETHQKLVESLAPFNQVWARQAPVLVLSVANQGEPGSPLRRFGFYDLGQAVAHLSIQATALGLHVHQMGGIDPAKARQLFDIPEGFEPVTVIAIGYFGDLEQLPEQLREREVAVRTRKPFADFVYKLNWSQPLGNS